MTDQSNDQGVIAALLQRFTEQRLPRTLRLKERVDAGEKLTESDIAFLGVIFKDANYNRQLANKHPEYQKLMAKVTNLYLQITERALKNEQQP